VEQAVPDQVAQASYMVVADSELVILVTAQCESSGAQVVHSHLHLPQINKVVKKGKQNARKSLY
jgi:hypothetical protein